MMSDESEYSDAQTPEQYVKEELAAWPLRCYTSKDCTTDGCTFNKSVGQCVPTAVDKDIGVFSQGTTAQEYFKQLPRHIESSYNADVLQEYCSKQSRNRCFPPCRSGWITPCTLRIEAGLLHQLIETPPPDASIFTKTWMTLQKVEGLIHTRVGIGRPIAHLVVVAGWVSSLAPNLIPSLIQESIMNAHVTAISFLKMLTHGSLNPGSFVVDGLQRVLIDIPHQDTIFYLIDSIIGAPIKEELVFRALPLAIEWIVNKVTDHFIADADRSANFKKINAIICCITSSLVFGYFHSGNYENPLYHESIMHCICAFVAGIVNYVVARKHGVRWSMLFHSVNNMVAEFNNIELIVYGGSILFPSKPHYAVLLAFHEKYSRQIEQELETTATTDPGMLIDDGLMNDVQMQSLEPDDEEFFDAMANDVLSSSTRT